MIYGVSTRGFGSSSSAVVVLGVAFNVQERKGRRRYGAMVLAHRSSLATLLDESLRCGVGYFQCQLTVVRSVEEER